MKKMVFLFLILMIGCEEPIVPEKMLFENEIWVPMGPIPIIYALKSMVSVGEEVEWEIRKSFHPEGISFTSEILDTSGKVLKKNSNLVERFQNPGTFTRILKLTDQNGRVSSGVSQVEVATEKPPIEEEKIFFFEPEYLAAHKPDQLKKRICDFVIDNRSFELIGYHAYGPELSPQFDDCWGRKEKSGAQSIHFSGVRVRRVGEKIHLWLWAGYSGWSQLDEAFGVKANGSWVEDPARGCPVIPDLDNGPPPEEGHRWQWAFVGII